MKLPTISRAMRAFMDAWWDAHHARKPETRAAAERRAREAAEKMTPDERERVLAQLGLRRSA